MTRCFACDTEADTALVGARLARHLNAPAFLALYGELGAGKTALVRGLGQALGTLDITSPTFMIVCEHDTKPRLLHFDAYRLSSADELYSIGFAEYLNEDALIVMEWADLVADALPQERLDITIHGSGEQTRHLSLTPHGTRYERMVATL